MPTPTTRLQLRKPLGTEQPDGAGQIGNLGDDVDQMLSIGGAEYCANLTAINAIPAARTFTGKLAYAADTDTIYRWNGAGWGTWIGVGALSFPGTVTNIGSDRTCSITRNGPTVTLNVAVFTGTNGMGVTGAVLQIPAGYRPKAAARHLNSYAFSNSDGSQNGSARLVAQGSNNGGGLFFESYSDGGNAKGTSFGGNFRFEGFVTYPGE